MGRIASSLLTGLNDKGSNNIGLNNIGLNNIGTIGSSLITGLSSIGINAMNANTQSQLADYQMKLMEDKFNSESKKFYSYTGQQAAKSLREYIYGDKDKDLIDSKHKNLFQNKRMYLS